ncbi:putative retrotransposon hot spot (RHS) protein [Trypanosoma cruzi]|uniref:Putative retrotransposon hot spot (RHS) protein n=1 Tax=Trypanosoma cruzi TaxID=5693 RepID=A0A2V2VXX0_TRYCR|nr:putative retrotransposon hot spot (RHS) protein [Trypanosoma cruzi]RNC41738.1 putative retrotransposon hot spot (RHS) protein [Trypanosoma cruzi]
MPPKRNRVQGGNARSRASAVPQGGQRRARPESEDVTDQPAATQIRVEARRPEWTMSSTVEDILLEGRTLSTNMKLNDFLRNYVGGTAAVGEEHNVTMQVFVRRPNAYVQDQQLLEEILNLTEYQVYKLHHEGVFSLEQWRDFKKKDTVAPLAREKLNAALTEVQKEEKARREAAKVPEAEILEGCYESVYNAGWHHVVEVPGGEGMGMEVREGEPPQSWTYKKVGLSLEKDDGVRKSGTPRPRLMVLTSDKGWPYSWEENKSIVDCYVNCEVERVWRIVRSDLTEWFSIQGRTDFEPKNRVLIGTPGIGKSMAAGSYLLYQLLHCDVGKLPVVVYVIGSKWFLFDKTIKTVTQYHTDEMSRSVISSLWQSGMKGYIIYDVARKGTPPDTNFAPPQWGMIVLTSPNVNNFEDWRRHREAAPIIINCPDEMDVKAMCIWKEHNGQVEEEEEEEEEQAREQAREQAEEQAREQAKYWETVEERMYEVGPIPRCIFDKSEYRIHLTAIDTTVKNINASNATDYMGVRRSEIWIAKDVSHKIVKVVRVRNENRVEVCYNAPVSHLARVKITHHLTNMKPPIDFLNLLLSS